MEARYLLSFQATMFSRGQDYLYPIQTHEEYGFFAGLGGDGRPVLMLATDFEILAIFFDSNGNLTEIQKRTVPRFHYAEALPSWQKEMNFKPGTIRVKKFFLPEYEAGIEDLPEHLAEFLANPEGYEKDERDRLSEFIQGWIQRGQFVFLWGNDYWVDNTGEVTDS